MPVITKGALTIDYAEEGCGETVVLVHSSGSGNRQWSTLTQALKDRYRVLAPNLFGYGETSPWPNSSQQTLAAQAELVLALCADRAEPVHLVGHSFGGAVALKAAQLLGERAGKLVLFEPIPFHLLLPEGFVEAHHEAITLAEQVKKSAADGDWIGARRFAEYWLGDGAWEAMPERKKAAFAASLTPVLYEFDAVLNERSSIEACTEIAAKTLVISDAEARPTIRAVVALLRRACRSWSFTEISGCGHMAPVTCPEKVNPLIRKFLDS